MRKVSTMMKWFEYHCFESAESADYALWLHSHQQVTVGKCENPEFMNMSEDERIDDGCPLVYSITFADGYKSSAFEDELLDDPIEYQRPDPPAQAEDGVAGVARATHPCGAGATGAACRR
jgi:hypothetical protein